MWEKMGDLKIDADKALTALGKCGRYQLMIVFQTSALIAISALQVMTSTFTSDTPPFYCHVGDRILTVNNTNSSNMYMNGSHFEECCSADAHGIYFETEEFGRTIVSDFGLVCEKRSISQLPTSLMMIGMLFGSLIIPYFSDRFGRRTALIGTCWSYMFFAFGEAFVGSIWLFSAFRFMAGFCNAAMEVVLWVLCSESICREIRSLAPVITGIAWTTGYTLLGLFAYFIRDWSYLYLAVACPLLLTIAFYWTLPESLHWLVANGHETEAKLWIERAAAFNGIAYLDVKTVLKGTEEIVDYLLPTEGEKSSEALLPSPVNFSDAPIIPNSSLQEAAAVKAQKQKKRSMLDIFTNPVLAIQALLISFIWVVNNLTYFGLSLFSTGLSGNKHLNYLLMGLVELPPRVSSPFIMHKHGRKPVSVSFHLLAGASLLSLAFLPYIGIQSGALQVALAMTGKFAINAAYYCIPLYISELFPTTVRSGGGGFCSTVSKIGGILAPYSQIVGERCAWLPPTAFGVGALLAAVSSLCLPETKGAKLPEDIKDAIPGPILGKCFGKKHGDKIAATVSSA